MSQPRWARSFDDEESSFAHLKNLNMPDITWHECTHATERLEVSNRAESEWAACTWHITCRLAIPHVGLLFQARTTRPSVSSPVHSAQASRIDENAHPEPGGRI